MKRKLTTQQVREFFDGLDKVFGLFNNHNGHYEAVGFDIDGNLMHFTHEGESVISLVLSVEVVHCMELQFCADDKPLDSEQDDRARGKWFTMLEKELSQPTLAIEEPEMQDVFSFSERFPREPNTLMADKSQRLFLGWREEGVPKDLREVSLKAALEWYVRCSAFSIESSGSVELLCSMAAKLIN